MPQTLRNALGTLFLAGTLLLGGCSGLAPNSLTVTQATDHATLVLNPELTSRGGLHTQAVVPRLTAEDVDHVRVQLLQVLGDTFVAVRNENGPLAIWVERSQLDRPIVLSQLHPNTHYQIRAWAYKGPDETDDNLISLDAPLDVLVGDDDRPTVAALRIQLKDVSFNGKATLPSFEILPGGYLPDGVESVEMTPMDVVKATLGFNWLGFDGDRMSQLTGEPDGLSDAHLRLSVDLPEGVSVKVVSLFATPDDGVADPAHSWTTWDYGIPQIRLLGVAHDGQLLNSGFVSTVGSFSGPTEFDLYAHTDGDFQPGKSYDVLIHLSNATVLWDTFTVPSQQEVTP